MDFCMVLPTGVQIPRGREVFLVEVPAYPSGLPSSLFPLPYQRRE